MVIFDLHFLGFGASGTPARGNWSGAGPNKPPCSLRGLPRGLVRNFLATTIVCGPRCLILLSSAYAACFLFDGAFLGCLGSAASPVPGGRYYPLIVHNSILRLPPDRHRSRRLNPANQRSVPHLSTGL